MFEFDESWLAPGAVVPITPNSLMACLREVQRLRALGSALQPAIVDLVLGEDGVYAVQEP